jgi:hypothetical protein
VRCGEERLRLQVENRVIVDWQECRQWRESKELTSKALNWFTLVIAATGVLQGGLFICEIINP